MDRIALGDSHRAPEGFSAIGAGHYLCAQDHTIWALRKADNGEFELVRLRDEPEADLRVVAQADESDSYERGVIVDAMARALFVSAWADAEEEAGRSHSGMELMDIAPATSPEAQQAAEELAARYEQANGKSLSALLDDAFTADGGQPGEAPIGYLEDFGHYLGMMGLGHGVSWFDDHAMFPLRDARVDFHLWAQANVYRQTVEPEKGGRSSDYGAQVAKSPRYHTTEKETARELERQLEDRRRKKVQEGDQVQVVRRGQLENAIVLRLNDEEDSAEVETDDGEVDEVPLLLIVTREDEDDESPALPWEDEESDCPLA